MEIQTSAEALAEFLKMPSSPDRQSTASTTFSVTSNKASPKEAAQAEAANVAKVLVTSSCQGCVVGCLEWSDRPPEDVAFTLLEIKPGYVVVRDVFEGPEMFSKVCWKLRSVDGVSGPMHPSCIAAGDHVCLEGPRWAMDRFCRGGSGGRGSEKASCSNSALVPQLTAAHLTLPSRSTSQGTLSRSFSGDRAAPFLGVADPSSDGHSSLEGQVPCAAAGGHSAAERRRAGPAGGAPPVPRLDLASVQARRERRLDPKAALLPKSFGACGFGLNMSLCKSPWGCL